MARSRSDPGPGTPTRYSTLDTRHAPLTAFCTNPSAILALQLELNSNNGICEQRFAILGGEDGHDVSTKSLVFAPEFVGVPAY